MLIMNMACRIRAPPDFKNNKTFWEQQSIVTDGTDLHKSWGTSTTLILSVLLLPTRSFELKILVKVHCHGSKSCPKIDHPYVVPPLWTCNANTTLPPAMLTQDCPLFTKKRIAWAQQRKTFQLYKNSLFPILLPSFYDTMSDPFLSQKGSIRSWASAFESCHLI